MNSWGQAGWPDRLDGFHLCQPMDHRLIWTEHIRLRLTNPLPAAYAEEVHQASINVAKKRSGKRENAASTEPDQNPDLSSQKTVVKTVKTRPDSGTAPFPLLLSQRTARGGSGHHPSPETRAPRPDPRPLSP